MAAQISLDITKSSEMTHVQNLINVNIKDLPQIKIEPITKPVTIMKQCSLPEPCNKHRCRFILPTEKSVTELPLTEVQRELAQYAADNNAQYISSENALKCLVELDKPWQIPIAVCNVFGLDGETKKVVVLGSDFALRRESVLVRTYRAFRHLLEYFLIPSSEKTKVLQKNEDNENQNPNNTKLPEDDIDSSDDEGSALCIDEDQIQMDISDYEDLMRQEETDEMQSKKTQKKINDESPNKSKKNEFYNCTCKDTYFEKPPPRSYKKWQFKNKETNESYDVIVHCSHRVRDETNEVYLEPIPEYQLDVGASEPTPDHIRSLLLALRLRNPATLLSVRVDNSSGDLVTFEKSRCEELVRSHPGLMEYSCCRITSACCQLHNLKPGHYLLKHEPNHGLNAMLYVSTPRGSELLLQFLSLDEAEPDDAKDLKTAPTLAPVLLPVHKFRRQLPCAFSPHDRQVRAPRPPPRHRTPPQALKWPKKKKKNKSRK